MICVSMDIGTNSTRLLIANVDGKNISPIFQKTTTTRMGKGLGAGNLTICEESINNNLNCLREYKEIYSKYNPDKVYLIGTQALRESTNSKTIINQIKDELNIDLHIISGDLEAKLSFIGGLGDMVLDIGGGSTELMLLDNGNISGASAPLGSLRLLEKNLSQKEINDTLRSGWKSIESSLLSIKGKGKRLVAVGGTATTLGAIMLGMVKYDPVLLDGTIVTKEQLLKTIELLESMSLEERLALPGMMKGREDILPWGLRILLEAMNITSVDRLSVSDRDLLYGIFMEDNIDELLKTE